MFAAAGFDCLDGWMEGCFGGRSVFLKQGLDAFIVFCLYNALKLLFSFVLFPLLEKINGLESTVNP